MASLNFSSDTLNFIKGLPAKQYRQVVGKIFSLLGNPMPSDCSKLKGYEDLYRVDAGEYRIVYKFSKKSVDVSLVGKRNGDEVYKKLDRKLKRPSS